MKGMISLVDFIKEVKKELRAAVDNEDPFFEMGEVELEVSFTLDASAKAGVKLLVADIGGQTKATQMHKVKIKLHPFVEVEAEQLPSSMPEIRKGAVTTVTTTRRVAIKGPHSTQAGSVKDKQKPKASKPVASVSPTKAAPRAG